MLMHIYTCEFVLPWGFEMCERWFRARLDLSELVLGCFVCQLMQLL